MNANKQNADKDVVITGIGLVSCHGVGTQVHSTLLNSENGIDPVIDTTTFAPYPVHPMPEIDWTTQISKRDQRQMGNWQRLGVYTAGLALDDAGLKDNEAACSSMDMIVAAGGGERDIDVDTLIVNEAMDSENPEIVVNEKLTTELRPTLFLAQLSNLLAGNISIVHKVTGSSRTFMGEEGAGISTIDIACAKIRAGQSTHALIGGSYNAERPDMLLLFQAIESLSTDKWSPIWQRDQNPGGGIITGSCSAFLVLESRKHAQARGAKIYAVIDDVACDRGKRSDGAFEKRLEGLTTSLNIEDTKNTAIFSGASGFSEISMREKKHWDEKLPDSQIFGYSGLIGHSLETQFPIGVALAALALSSGTKTFDSEKLARNFNSILVTTVGHDSAEGLAVLRTNKQGDKTSDK